ncbi:MAG: ABC transporter substrate-binding protein [Sulfurimicrobium sp.]|nr:ABC transporter substrate-binding protein [Sulfurimicrobium sp.]MDP1704243.1 ABC transporter substrate-binding protein [Sulfurimicrobium sp.]MDP2197109.1 ABC transporter substrate-binding protein [Sulfurimicrobium sp.]
MTVNPSRRKVLKALSALPLTAFSGTATAKTSRTPIRINIPGPRSLPFLPIELIPILGIDYNQGVQLIIRYFPSGVRALEDMLAGSAQFSAQGFTVLHAFHSKGYKAQALAPLSGQVPPYGIVVRNELRKQVKSVTDLKGRSIGVSVGNVTSKTYLQQVTEVFLITNGIKPHEVRWVPTAQNWDGQFGALSSGSVDAVFCEEPFMSGLARHKAGFVLSDFSDPRIMAKIPGAGHLRATLTASSEYLKLNSPYAETMVRMLSQSFEWIAKTDAAGVVNRLNLQDKDEKLELIDVLTRQRGMYPSDARFSRRQIEATAQFMRAAGILADEAFDINTLINSQIAGVKP